MNLLYVKICYHFTRGDIFMYTHQSSWDHVFVGTLSEAHLFVNIFLDSRHTLGSDENLSKY